MGPIAYVSGVTAVVFAAAFIVPCCVDASAQQAPAPACGTDEIARAIVSRVSDGRTFTLSDGRVVRLAGVEVPPLPMPQESNQDSNKDPSAAPDGSAARDALDALTGGNEVLLRRAETDTDRYGRIVAYAYSERDGDKLFVQGELVASGFARVSDRIGSRASAVDLLKRETAARATGLGLWANPYYAVLDAGTPADVLAQKGHFALVQGEVVSVRESGATICVNFGRRRSEDFTVTVLKRNERNFAAAGLDLSGLAGRRILVRGFVEARGMAGSPRIEAERPEQIEIVDGD
jgi:endonuclease YncB( thermonuclease family)